MRRIASMAVPGRLMLLDGVKVVQKDSWALVIPHPEEPSCLVWAEAPAPEESNALADRYADRVRAIVAERRSARVLVDKST